MEQNKYQDGLIYTIKTDNGIYVGSTCDFAQRKRAHNSVCFNEDNKEHKRKLYQNIRENDGEYTIEIYKLFPCNSEKELCAEEDEVRKFLNANLNTYKCIRTKEEELEYREKNKERTKEYDKEYQKKNKEIISQKRSEIITCECGCKSTKQNISTHRKTKKHLNLMEVKMG